MAEKTVNDAQTDILTFEETRKALKYASVSDTPIHLVGPPGIGKSALVEDVASQLKMSLETLLLSQCDPTDIGGFPVADGHGGLVRLPLGPLKRATKVPSVLFLDELSCATPAVQGAALQLIYNRNVGDGRLHPDSRIIAASNPANQAAGGWNMALPLISRLTQIRMRPTLKEVQSFFYNLKGSESFKALGIDLAATMESAPELLQIDPPAGSEQAAQQWGNGRSWVRALAFCSAALDGGEADGSPIFIAGLSGNVGESAGLAFQNIRKIRNELPKVSEILENPDTTNLPKNLKTGIAVLGILAQVAMKDRWAAWLYASRLEQDEIKMATFHIVGKVASANKETEKSSWQAEGTKAMKKMLTTLGGSLRND